MIFETKPCEIEAIQWTTDNTEEIKEFCGKYADHFFCDTAWEVGKGIPVDYLNIHTLEGDIKASRGDFIIKGIAGEFYPCKPDIFMKKYKPKGLDDYFDLHNIDCEYRIYRKITQDLIDFWRRISVNCIYKLIEYGVIERGNFHDIEKGSIILSIKRPITKENIIAIISKDKYFLYNDYLYTTEEILDKITTNIGPFSSSTR